METLGKDRENIGPIPFHTCELSVMVRTTYVQSDVCFMKGNAQ